MTATTPETYGRHADPAYRVQEPSTTYPMEPKVRASITASGAAAIVSAAVVRLIDDLAYGGGDISVPWEYVAGVGLVFNVAAVWAAGWFAPHVERITRREL